MHVRLKSDRVGGYGYQQGGQIIAVPQDEGQRLLERGEAEFIPDNLVQQLAEAAALKPSQTAERTPRIRRRDQYVDTK